MLRRFLGLEMIGLILMIASVQLTGCSAIGYGVGRGLDNLGGDYINKPPCALESVKEGADVRVITVSDSICEGRFGGIEQSKQHEYAIRYATFQRDLLAANTGSPGIGDKSVVYLNSGDSMSGSFSGFDLLFGVNRRQPDRKRAGYTSIGRCKEVYCGAIHSTGDSLPDRVLLQDLKYIVSKDGDTLSGERLDYLAHSGLLPLRSTVVVQQDELKSRIPIEQVSRVECRKKKQARWVLLGLGAVFDAIIIVAAIRGELFELKAKGNRPDWYSMSCSPG
ncbi:MAG: hypothetical protein JSU65_09445 [Candidatus Zixiibacteriota bacterium]|nr:MAG: hypothetical protein JSU65_09445 [candidate division Zixibacteria bacterium]